MFTEMKPLADIIDKAERNYDLEKIKNAFVDFRYFYEGKMEGIPFNIYFLKLIKP